MTLIRTETLQPGQLSPQENLQVYCGLDCCVTLEVREELGKQFNQPPAIYDFERALQGPYLEIMERGWLVDETSRQHALRVLEDRISLLRVKLNKMAQAVWDRPLNPRSYSQLKDFFYGAMKLPEVWISQKGERKLSTNREALEKLEEQYIHSRPIIACILGVRDLEKQKEVFETEIDQDGRFRTSYNIAGTETGRLSSSRSAYGTGGNTQNIDPRLRYVFQSDPGYKLGQIDLEQVEGRDVGWFCGVLFGDWSYLDSCESGDLHTSNCRLSWPRELPWTGDLKADKALADSRLFYRDWSYRHLMKRGSYLTNYMGSAWTASRVMKLPLSVMEEFQARYCLGREADYKKGLSPIDPAFPCIPQFWQWVAQQIQTVHLLETPFGRRRHFFGRPEAAETLREAIAFLPQSTTADRMNLGLWRIWRHESKVQLLGNGFDSVIFQYPEGTDEDELMPRLLDRIRVRFTDPTSGRIYEVPGEAKVGWNWGQEVQVRDRERARREGKNEFRLPRLNPLGLRKWVKGERDLRERPQGLRRIML